MEKNTKGSAGILKIGITGPESSGKSWLAKSLARTFNDVWLPEYAREYLEQLAKPYDIHDLNVIAKQQLALEERYTAKAKRILFCDTDAVVLYVWYKNKFGTIPDFIEEALASRSYDLHLVMRPDIPYEEDPLRENPERGDFFFDQFLITLEHFQLAYEIIEGPFPERIKKAREIIQSLMNVSLAKK